VVKPQNVVWKLQATRDEAYLYVRFEATSLLPPAGSRLTAQASRSGNPGGLPASPTLRVKVGEDRSFLVSVRDLVSAKGTVDRKGKAAGDRNTMAYSLFVKNGAGEDIYETTIGEDTVSQLLAVEGKFIDVKLPLSGLGIEGGAPITLEEADAVMQILPYAAAAFAGKE
jgi:hypothetical protein